MDSSPGPGDSAERSPESDEASVDPGIAAHNGVSSPVNPLLQAALARWDEVASRFRMPEPVRAAGSLLLAAELDEEARGEIIGTEAAVVAPRRSDILRALSAAFGLEHAAAGLARLEQRGIAVPLAGHTGPWLSAELELDSRVRAQCLGAGPEPEAAGPAHAIARLELAIQMILARIAESPRRFVILVRGRGKSARDFVCARLLAGLGATALRRSVSELRQHNELLEPELSGSVPIWDARRADPSPEDYDIARRWLTRSTTVAIAILDRHQDAPDVDDRLVLPLDVDPESAEERSEAWAEALARAGVGPAVAAEAAEQLSARSRGGAGLIFRASLMIADPSGSVAAIVADAGEQLAALVSPSTLRGVILERPDVPLDRIIAPADTLQALRQIVLLARLSSAVESPGRVGVKALFSGPSGTGKTMAARAMATELRLPLYRVDLASVVSKWVGETEKNLREALAAAEAAGAVLLFDEGDALFGKRGEVSRGADRYANMEVSYLLQAIEAYDGIAVVTTNARNNVDAAFERRFDACIEFQPSAPAERAAIWRQELGEAGVALSDDLLVDIARRADLNGGSIAAAVRTARVLCLHGGRAAVDEQDLRGAVRIELLKSGSSVQAARWQKTER
jgi:hypothetical protein